MAKYVIRDAFGEYLTPAGTWTPASDEAAEYKSKEDVDSALVGCGRTTARVLRRTNQKPLQGE